MVENGRVNFRSWSKKLFAAMEGPVIDLEALCERLLADDPSITFVHVVPADLLTPEFIAAERRRRKSTLVKVDGSTFSSGNIKALAYALIMNTTVKTFWTYGIPLGAPGVGVISEIVKANSTIRELGLWGCGNLNDNAAAALADGLRVNTSIMYLRFTGSEFSRAGDKKLWKALIDNYSVLECWGGPSERSMYPIVNRNRGRHAARQAALQLIMIKKFRRNRLLTYIQRGVMLMIAKMVYRTREDVCWKNLSYL